MSEFTELEEGLMDCVDSQILANQATFKLLKRAVERIEELENKYEPQSKTSK